MSLEMSPAAPRSGEMLTVIRQRQTVEELARKQKKARRRGWWTQEDIDLAKAEAHELYEALGWGKP